MKLNKIDLYNLGCLKLREMEVWNSDRCLEAMNFQRMNRARTQARYIKRLLKELARIDAMQPGLIEKMFKLDNQPKLDELEEIKNERNKNKEEEIC